MKAFLFIAGLALSLTAAQFAKADQDVYSKSSGRWHMAGSVSDSDPSQNSCVLSTQWADGKRVNVNIFPKINGSSNVTATIFDPSWYFVGEGNSIPVNVIFKSGKYGTLNRRATAQVKDEQRLIFRGMTASFANTFIHYDTMTFLFSHQADDLTVSLSGTVALRPMLRACISKVMGNYYGGFEDTDPMNY